MKNKYNGKFMSLLLLVSVFSALTSYAQGSSTHGGDPNELAEFPGKDGVRLASWFSVKQNLIEGLKLGFHRDLDLGMINPDTFKTEVLLTLQSATIEWDDQPILVQQVRRVCENYRTADGAKKIHCNQTDYAKAMNNYDPDTQYKFIGHEYLSLSGFEPNSYGSSDYPISSQISESLGSVTFKRWIGKTNPNSPLLSSSVSFTPDLAFGIDENRSIQKQVFQMTVSGEMKQDWPFSRNDVTEGLNHITSLAMNEVEKVRVATQKKIDQFLLTNHMPLGAVITTKHNKHRIDERNNTEKPFGFCTEAPRALVCEIYMPAVVIIESKSDQVIVHQRGVTVGRGTKNKVMQKCEDARAQAALDPSIIFVGPGVFYDRFEGQPNACTFTSIYLEKR